MTPDERMLAWFALSPKERNADNFKRMVEDIERDVRARIEAERA